jgi:hypothetical protein
LGARVKWWKGFETSFRRSWIGQRASGCIFQGTTLESEEVPPDLEDEPDAGVPDFAKMNGLIRTLEVATLQDVVSNARFQRPQATLDELFNAFRFYHDRDAFIQFE